MKVKIKLDIKTTNKHVILVVKEIKSTKIVLLMKTVTFTKLVAKKKIDSILNHFKIIVVYSYFFYCM